MHLLPVSLVFFAMLQGQAQPGDSQQTAGAALTRASFSANGLANERLLTNLYLGNFTEVDLARSDVLFMALYSVPTATAPPSGVAAPETTTRGSASTVPPASSPAAGQRVQPGSASGAAVPTVRPATPNNAVNAPAPAAPAVSAEQQRQQRAEEIQKRTEKFKACVATFQQALKDHPEAQVEVVKEYTSCIQAK